MHNVYGWIIKASRLSIYYQIWFFANLLEVNMRVWIVSLPAVGIFSSRLYYLTHGEWSRILFTSSSFDHFYLFSFFQFSSWFAVKFLAKVMPLCRECFLGGIFKWFQLLSNCGCIPKNPCSWQSEWWSFFLYRFVGYINSSFRRSSGKWITEALPC